MGDKLHQYLLKYRWYCYLVAVSIYFFVPTVCLKIPNFTIKRFAKELHKKPAKED